VRVAILTSAPLPPHEGIGFYVHHLAHELLRKGHTCEVITRGGARRVAYRAIGGIPVWEVPYVPLYPFHVHVHGLFVARLVRQLAPDLDVLHVHTPLSPAIRFGVPIVATMHSSRKAAVRAAPRKDVGWLTSRLMAPVSRQIEGRLLARARLVTTTSRAVAEDVQAFGVPPERILVLGNGVDAERFAPRFDRAPGRATLLYVGRLHAQKGLFDLLACMQHVVSVRPEAVLSLVGSGPLEAELRRLTRALGLPDHVEFVGHLGEDRRDELVRHYQEATVLVHPSYYEGMPTTVLEAMACGTPVVTTAVSGALDLIEPDVNGLLVPVGQPEALAHAVLRLLDDAALQRALGLAARATIESEYTWDRVSDKYLLSYMAAIRGFDEETTDRVKGDHRRSDASSAIALPSRDLLSHAAHGNRDRRRRRSL
jgi:glycosyltransferase involved in cell wall biosynthesis